MRSEKGASRLVVVVVLLVVFVVGFLVGQYVTPRREARAPGEVPPQPPKVREVAFNVEKKEVTYKHPPIVVSVDRKDRVVWRSDQVQNFTVTLAPETTGAPSNPFAVGSPAEWSTQNGRVELGPAIPEAKDHKYKFTIKVKPDGPTLDPHIIFE